MTYYVDGYTTYSNPSFTGGGFTVATEGNNIITKSILKENFTNNEAELCAVNYAAQICDIRDIIITDSEVMISWLDREHLDKKKRGRKDLDPLKLETIKLLEDKYIELIWSPREKNLAG